MNATVASKKTVAIVEVVYVNIICPNCNQTIANNDGGNVYLHDLRTMYPIVHCEYCDLNMEVSSKLVINHDPRQLTKGDQT